MEQVLLNLLFAEFKMVGIVKEKEREIDGRLVNIIETLSNIIKTLSNIIKTLSKREREKELKGDW